jgi:hypothetical protein
MGEEKTNFGAKYITLPLVDIIVMPSVDEAASPCAPASMLRGCKLACFTKVVAGSIRYALASRSSWFSFEVCI